MFGVLWYWILVEARAFLCFSSGFPTHVLPFIQNSGPGGHSWHHLWSSALYWRSCHGVLPHRLLFEASEVSWTYQKQAAVTKFSVYPSDCGIVTGTGRSSTMPSEQQHLRGEWRSDCWSAVGETLIQPCCPFSSLWLPYVPPSITSMSRL